MPYESCPRCGLRTYCVRGAGGPPGGGGAPPRARPRRELRMDAALLTEVVDGHEVVLAAVGNGRIPGVVSGANAPLRDTICQRLLDGTIDAIVRDTAGDTRTRDLPAVRTAGLGAYIGVPLGEAVAARRYVLCCLAGEARPDLTDADVRFLHGLVESLRPAVEAVAGDD